MNITALGEPRFPSPIRRTVSDGLRVPEQIARELNAPAVPELLFEIAGPRSRLFFDPKQTRAGIVTCGGLCPGLNDVIRSLFLELHHAYGVKEVLGYLHDKFIHVPVELLTRVKKTMDPAGFAWSAVLAATGQPEVFE